MWNVRNVRHNGCLFLSFDEILMTIVIERCSRIHSIRHSTNQHQYLRNHQIIGILAQTLRFISLHVFCLKSNNKSLARISPTWRHNLWS